MRYALAVLMLAGCMPDIAGLNTRTDLQTVRPQPFPHPGIYSGLWYGSTFTVKMSADGRGLSCIRNTYGGRLFLGDAIYDGARLHTEDAPFDVDSVTAQELHLRMPHHKTALRRTDAAPTLCRDFFKDRP